MKRKMYLSLMLFALSGSTAFAALSIAKPFTLAASGEYTLGVSDGTTVTDIHGNLRIGVRSPENTVGRIHAQIKAYNDSLISVALSQNDDDNGYIFILERQNSVYESINKLPILTRKVGMTEDLDGTIEHLQSTGYKEDQALIEMAKFFDSAPSKKLDAYYRQVERDNVRPQAPPPPKVVKRTPPPPPPPPDEEATTPTDSTLQADQAALALAQAQAAAARRQAVREQQCARAVQMGYAQPYGCANRHPPPRAPTPEPPAYGYQDRGYGYQSPGDFFGGLFGGRRPF